jgi:hypothetical protein
MLSTSERRPQAVSPFVQSLTPPCGRMPGADRTRRRVGEGSSPELVIEWGDDSTQFSAGALRQRPQGGVQLVARRDQITVRAGTVLQRNIQPAARLTQEPSIPIECLENAPAPQMAGLHARDGGLRSPADAGNRCCRSAIADFWSVGADSAGLPTRHCPFGSTSCRHGAISGVERHHPTRSATGLPASTPGVARVAGHGNAVLRRQLTWPMRYERTGCGSWRCPPRSVGSSGHECSR